MYEKQRIYASDRTLRMALATARAITDLKRLCTALSVVDWGVLHDSREDWIDRFADGHDAAKGGYGELVRKLCPGFPNSFVLRTARETAEYAERFRMLASGPRWPLWSMLSGPMVISWELNATREPCATREHEPDSLSSDPLDIRLYDPEKKTMEWVVVATKPPKGVLGHDGEGLHPVPIEKGYCQMFVCSPVLVVTFVVPRSNRRVEAQAVLDMLPSTGRDIPGDYWLAEIPYRPRPIPDWLLDA